MQKKVIYCIQVISIFWIQGLTFRRLHSCQSWAAFLERNILEDWVFSLKLVLWEMGQLWIHPSPWLQHWVRMSEKTGKRKRTNTHRQKSQCAECKVNRGTRKGNFLTYLACAIFVGESNNCVWMRRRAWGRGGEEGPWEREREREREFDKISWDNNCTSNIWYSRRSPHVKRAADDTDWSDLADLIREERVHLVNETSNLVKH